jgi:class 3 adenylate cyclase
MQLYNSYIDVIRQAINSTELQKGRKLTLRDKGMRPILEHRRFDAKVSEKANQLDPTASLYQLARLLGRKSKLPISGDHPDFVHLRATPGMVYEYHYIVSIFMDVKNSTSLFRKYTLEQIPIIIQAIVTAATHTCALFDGHIQRMQYDGVFAYFGGKGCSPEDAVKNAINAASFFNYFVKYELPVVFEAFEINPIFTRTGIDFGEDSDTIWSIYGTGDCTELTTTSLHTSLAPKMQSCASSNGIMVGDNVKLRMGANAVFCDLKRLSNGNVDEAQRYIFEDPDDNFYYTQYNFSWDKYLRKTYDFVKTNDKGKLFIDYDPTITDQELARRLMAAHTANELESGRSSLDKNLNIIKGSSGIIVPRERNHYEDPR